MCYLKWLKPETPKDRRDVSIIVGLIGLLAVMVITWDANLITWTRLNRTNGKRSWSYARPQKVRMYQAVSTANFIHCARSDHMEFIHVSNVNDSEFDTIKEHFESLGIDVIDDRWTYDNRNDILCVCRFHNWLCSGTVINALDTQLTWKGEHMKDIWFVPTVQYTPTMRTQLVFIAIAIITTEILTYLGAI